MDNKEAVSIIRSNWPDNRYSMLREALEQAIKALETEDSKTVGKNPEGETK